MENYEDRKDFAGKNGFIWWIGVIEDRQDPIKLGRCRVRCIGWHSDNKMDLPTENLPWAFTSLPTNNSNPYAPKESDMVFGFFIDGENAQQPVILGVLPSIPLGAGNAQQAFGDGRTQAELDSAPVKPNESKTLYPRNLDEPTTSRLARNDSDYISPILTDKADKKLDKVEPDSYYNAQYPYNNVYESESGHAFEIDDTPDNERIHLYHRSGSYVEYGPEGDRSERIQKDKFTVVVGNDSVYIQGDVTVFVDGNATVDVGGDASVGIGGNATVDIGGDASVGVGGDVSMQVGGSFNAEIGGTCDITSGGDMSFAAPNIYLN
jgi:hypothetical protein